jgi:hypothetical protein
MPNYDFLRQFADRSCLNLGGMLRAVRRDRANDTSSGLHYKAGDLQKIAAA